MRIGLRLRPGEGSLRDLMPYLKKSGNYVIVIQPPEMIEYFPKSNNEKGPP